MEIALVQSDIVWGDPAANRKRLDSLLSSAPRADLYVLPEMFSTGFNGVCESDPSETLGYLCDKACSCGCAFAGSLAISFPDRLSANRFFFVTPEEQFFYDKRHLFTYAGEQKRFAPGAERKVLEWRGVRFLPIVCYDLRFPVWSRNRGDYDVLICVANWPVQRRYAWDTLLRARAIENQSYVVAVNRTGSDPGNEYNGGSVLLDPLGREIAVCEDGKEEVVSAAVDLDSLRGFRKNFPALMDADEFEIEF